MIGIILAFIFLRHCAGQTITIQPVSINTTINSTVTFTCEGAGDSIAFRVNGTAIFDNVRDRGFCDETFNDNGTRRGELEATAYEFNNNTNISCRVSTDDPVAALFSDVAILMIQGLLDSVSDLDYTFINGSSVFLTWTAPYTLDNVPITGYYIVLNGLVNITTIDNNTNITLSAANLDPCLLNNVFVSPINDVGIGSPNNVSFYYETVSPNVSVTPVCHEELIYISINVSTICEREYPDSIAVIILNSDSSTVVNNVTIIPQINYQLMIATGNTSIPSCNDTFIVNVSLSNTEGTLNELSPFKFVYLGPVTNIDFSIVNCSTINITWTAPTVDDRVSIQYYILRVYDSMTIPRSAVETDFMVNYTQNQTVQVSTVHYNISIAKESTSRAPVYVTLTIECNETGIVYVNTTLVENPIKGSVPVPLYNHCSFISFVSNCTGSSERFQRSFNTTPSPPTISNTPSPTNPPASDNANLIISIIVPSVVVIALFILILILVVFCCLRKIDLKIMEMRIKT
uniref:Fibronectin type-III domain-containing protein n=1 Tax=Amphimedon queenslandica TaxID=400682 RepID=A0A1X7T4U1_AMPQE